MSRWFQRSRYTDSNYETDSGPVAFCRVAKCVEACREKLIRAGFQELVFEDAMSVVQDKIAQAGRMNDPLLMPEWEIVMQDEVFSSYVVMFLRLLTSCEIQLRRAFFEPFIMVSAQIVLRVRSDSFGRCVM